MLNPCSVVSSLASCRAEALRKSVNFCHTRGDGPPGVCHNLKETQSGLPLKA